MNTKDYENMQKSAKETLRVAALIWHATRIPWIVINKKDCELKSEKDFILNINTEHDVYSMCVSRCFGGYNSIEKKNQKLKELVGNLSWAIHYSDYKKYGITIDEHRKAVEECFKKYNIEFTFEGLKAEPDITAHADICILLSELMIDFSKHQCPYDSETKISIYNHFATVYNTLTNIFRDMRQNSMGISASRTKEFYDANKDSYRLELLSAFSGELYKDKANEIANKIDEVIIKLIDEMPQKNNLILQPNMGINNMPGFDPKKFMKRN